MPQLVCKPCRLFLRPEKNGYIVEEGMPGAGRIPATDPSGWSPYKLWRADLWKCPGCGAEVVAGFAPHPFAEHYQPDYLKWREASPPDLFVPDCC